MIGLDLMRKLSSLALLLSAAPALALAGDTDLSSSSLEDLTRLRISVHTFARKNQDLWKTPAAVYVITNEQIARSAASSIPDLLRVVPGLQVAQIDASTWAVTIRGFNNQFADKVLVLVDGRTVYSEIFSGVNWDEVDVSLEDIDRIEVIRGPGAAVWGTNAVNGVINILTKPSRSTSGSRISGHVSRLDEAVDGRYGGTHGNAIQYRAYLGFLNRKPFELASGAEAFDGEHVSRLGGRLDWQDSSASKLVFMGDAYTGRLRNQIDPQVLLNTGPDGHDSESLAGGHLLGLWEHKNENAETALQAYYSDQSRHQLGTDIRTRTFDVDYQNHAQAGHHSDLVWGGEARFTSDHIEGSQSPTQKPEYKNYLVDGFFQDDITLFPNRLIATLGSKVQDGTLAGFQVQPSARLLGVLSSKQILWAAASRAAVAPDIQEKYSNVPLSEGSEQGLPVLATQAGNPQFKPETVKAFEVGYRRRVTNNLTFDLAGFDNENSRVTSVEVSDPSLIYNPTPHIAVTILDVNGYRARTDGAETTIVWRPTTNFEAVTNYAWLESHTHQVLPGNLTLLDSWNTPRSSSSTSLWWEFLPRWEANVFVSYVDHLSGADGSAASQNSPSRAAVPGYTRLDAHLARAISNFLEVDAGGTNLLTPRHLEFGRGEDFVVSSQVPRSFYLKVKVIF